MLVEIGLRILSAALSNWKDNKVKDHLETSKVIYCLYSKLKFGMAEHRFQSMLELPHGQGGSLTNLLEQDLLAI